MHDELTHALFYSESHYVFQCWSPFCPIQNELYDCMVIHVGGCWNYLSSFYSALQLVNNHHYYFLPNRVQYHMISLFSYLLKCVCFSGVQTPNCIRQTVFDAVALDYEKVTVIMDATAAANAEIHLGKYPCKVLHYATCYTSQLINWLL